MNFWEYFVHSNAFNFLIMLVILSVLAKKINLAAALDGIKNSIIEIIEKSKQEKRAANKKLKVAQKNTANLDNEVKDILKNAKTQAKTLAQKILDETGVKITQIEAGVQKFRDTEEKLISSRLGLHAANRAVEAAKADIMEQLQQKPELHQHFINEGVKSIESL